MIKYLFNLFLLAGSEWVLWLLVCSSLLGFAVIIMKRKTLSNQERVGQKLWEDHIAQWQVNGLPTDWKAQANDLSKRYPSMESRLIHALSKRTQISSGGLDRVSHSFITSERLSLESYTAILGTLGNSAPFIGLFGTVLGIIRAFADLSGGSGNAGLNSVSAGLSEALVTTATGLLVAIPCAMAFNYFQRKIKSICSRSSSIAALISGTEGETI